MSSSLRFIAVLIIGFVPQFAVAQTTVSPTILYLQEYRKAPARIIDFNYNKLLVIDNGPQSNPRLYDVLNQSITAIPYQGRVMSGYVTPQGAVFCTRPSGASAIDSIYDFNNGTLISVAQSDTSTLKAAGSFCIWAKTSASAGISLVDSLFLRDLSTQTNTLVTHYALDHTAGLGTSNEIAANGLVAYIDSTQNLVKYLNNSHTVLTTYPGTISIGAANPLSDGHNIVYTVKDESTTYAVTTGPQGDAGLTMPTRDWHASPQTGYQVNNKFVAFIRTGYFSPEVPFFTNQLWLRDTLGVQAQVPTGTATSFSLDHLNPHGDIMLQSRYGNTFRIIRLLLPRLGSTIYQIDTAAGKTYYRDTTWYIAIDSTLYTLKSTLEEPPPVPQWQALKATYCQTAGAQKVKIMNLPADTSKTHVRVQLSGIALPVNLADSTVTFSPAALSTGTQTFDVTYTNGHASSSGNATFIVITAVTPLVKLSTDVTNVPVLPTPVILTATNMAGGGTTPQYTFAKDRAFTSILQAQSTSNQLTLSSGNLAIGSNKIYARMTTSDTCYTVASAVDSVVITRSLFSGIVDPDGSKQTIRVLPNPFYRWIMVTGLDRSKSYLITLTRSNGQQVFQRPVINSFFAEFHLSETQKGLYILTIYDKTNDRILGNMRLLRM
ncbi:hypothetical protein [Paraflavitalea sp. CAU 1676]|uniref:hypothetical protein n=1 Tax=Paraflavitalea sp. CAU 1676 TaxID=3032598 RepID=UPI0023DB4068|nr:hypothetical protein [Paraflavitalea sp. CAU 1676]MDF2190344.1 hypothetical protein [Paraflavitalea sp. CAU 1676]